MPTLLLVRPENRQAEDKVWCEQYGWQVLPFAPIRLEANLAECNCLPLKIKQAQAVFWVSPSAVEIATPYLSHTVSSGSHIAVGKATAQALARIGIHAHYSSIGNDSEHALTLPIWDTLPRQAHIVIVRADEGREYLAQNLYKRGFCIPYAPIYRKVIQTLAWQDFEHTDIDAVWITSTQMAQLIFDQAPLFCMTKLRSLSYFTQHQRIADRLHILGAKRVFVVANLSLVLNGRIEKQSY